MSNEKYMLIRSRMLKVPLKAVDDKFEIKSGKKTLLSTLPSIERYFTYIIYGEQDESEIALWLRERLDKNITPMEIDRIIDRFKKSHPIQEIESLPLEETPLYATEDDGMQLPLPYGYCTISLDNEKELIYLIAEYEDYAFEYIEKWFLNYRMKYALNYPKTKNVNVEYDMALSFLNQHGFDSQILSPEEIAQEQKKYKIDTTVMVLSMLLPMLFLFRWVWVNDFLLFKKSVTLAIICGAIVGGVVVFSSGSIFLRTKRISVLSVLGGFFVGIVISIFVFFLYFIIQFFI
jgi:hypothetical protein